METKMNTEKTIIDEDDVSAAGHLVESVTVTLLQAVPAVTQVPVNAGPHQAHAVVLLCLFVVHVPHSCMELQVTYALQESTEVYLQDVVEQSPCTGASELPNSHLEVDTQNPHLEFPRHDLH